MKTMCAAELCGVLQPDQTTLQFPARRNAAFCRTSSRPAQAKISPIILTKMTLTSTDRRIESDQLSELTGENAA